MSSCPTLEFERIRAGSLSRGVLTISLVLLATLGLTSAAPAADFADELSNLSLEELLDVDVVYGASKFEQATSEAPASITIIRAEEIEQFGYESLADVFQSVRGFYSTYDRSYNYSGVRGFARPGDYSTRVLLLIDGHRINDNIYDSVPMGNEFPLDFELVDRIEIIRGPGSSLYGTSAMLAVINVITRSASDQTDAQVQGEAGSYGVWDGAMAVGRQFAPTLRLLVRGSYFQTDGQDFYLPEFDEPLSNNGRAQGVDGEDRFRLFSKLEWNALYLQLIYSSREKFIPNAPWDIVFNDSRNRLLDAYGHALLGFSHQLNPTWTFTSKFSYNAYFYDGDYAYDYSEDDEPYIVVNKDEARGKWISSEARWTGVLSLKHRITGGFEGNYSLQEIQKNYDIEGEWLDDRRHSSDWGAYVQHEYRPATWLILNAGVRHDHHDQFGGTTNPRGAAIVVPSTGSVLKLLYGQAFRAPNSFELYYNDGGLVEKANPSIDPEEITTWELVLEHYLGANTFVTASTYQYTLDGLIAYRTDPEDELLYYDNLEEAEARGIELELKRAWTRGPTGRLSYAFQEATDKTTGALLTNSPKHLAKLNFRMPLSGPDLTAGLQVLYTGKRITLGGATLDDVAVTNLTLAKSGLWTGLSVSASIYNVFDIRYDDPGSEEHPEDSIEQNGRNLRVRVQYSF